MVHNGAVSTPATRLAELLNHRSFQFLDPKALGALASVVQEFRFEAGDVVYFSQDEPEGALFVLEGCLEETVSDLGVLVGPGEFWQKERLWSNPPFQTLLKGKTAGRYFLFARTLFVEWVKRYADQIPILAASSGPDETPWDSLALESLRVEPPRSIRRFPLLLEKDEYLKHRFSRSRLFTGFRMALPAFFFFQALAYGLVFQFRFSDQIPAFFLWILPVITLTVSGFFWILLWVEKGASCVLITNKSLILRQLHIWDRKSEFQKIPLDKIQEAVTVKRGIVDHLLRLATLEVDSDSAQGKIVFSGLAGDGRFLKALDAARSEVTTQRKVSKQKIRASLEAHFGTGRKPERISEDPVPPKKKRKLFSWRTDHDGRIRFRRHPWVLWRKTLRWWGLFLLALFLGATAWAVWGDSGRPVFLICLLVALVPGGHFFWAWLDWINDSLFLEGDKIVSLHKKPLWGQEVRQEGALMQIQQIGIRKESFTAIALDYGDLVVHLGGGDPLVFERAAHPEWVQAEIFRRRQELVDLRQRREAEARVDEVSDVLKAFEQAKDQGYFNPEEDHSPGEPS